MSSTKIEWCNKVWNPVTGCKPVSEGCEYCYAERMAKRLAGRYGYPKGHPFAPISHFDNNEPLKWKKPKKIFVCSMGDLFHEDNTEHEIREVFSLIGQCPQHTFIILTKRPENMKEFILSGIADNYFSYFMHYDASHLGQFPVFPHVWLGVSVENQKRADERIPILLQIPAARRFVSCEPMLGPINLKSIKWAKIDTSNWKLKVKECWSMVDALAPYKEPKLKQGEKLIISGMEERIDWVIAGGESGPNARPSHPDWIRSLRDQCQVAGVPFFFKQYGEWAPVEGQGVYPKDICISENGEYFEAAKIMSVFQMRVMVVGCVMSGRKKQVGF